MLDAHLHPLFMIDQAPARERLLQARATGLDEQWLNAVTEDDWETLVRWSREIPGVRVFLGIHPWHVQGSPGDAAGRARLERLEALLTVNPGIAVGETGLDRSRNDGKEQQRYEWTLAQIRIARKLGRPVAFHVVRAWGQFLELLEEWKPGDLPFMLHSYTGSAEFQRQLSRQYRVWFSYSPFVLDSGSERIQESLRQVPLDRLLLETDYPSREDLEKQPALGSLPALSQHYQRVALLKHIPLGELSAQLAENALSFFRR